MKIESDLRMLVDQAGTLSPDCLCRLAGTISLIGTLRDDSSWTRAILRNHDIEESELPPEPRILLALDHGEPDALTDLVTEEGLPPALRTLIGALIGEEVDRTDLLAEAERMLTAPLLRTTDVLRTQATVALIEALASSEPSLSDSLRAVIGSGLTGALHWLDQRKADTYLEPLLRRFGKYLTQEEQRAWRKRIDKRSRPSSRRSQERSGEGVVRLGMVGSITVRSGDSESVRVRGSRLRVLLGLMVADRMLDHPLAQNEFLRIAVGDDHAYDGGMDQARNIVKVSIHRLREMLGHDAILTDAETPRLNLRRIEVDLLEAHLSLREAANAARQNVLARARTALGRALDLIGGEVAFPSLYDRFFEAARDDFEAELRATLLNVAQGLLREGDAASAESLLDRGFRLMPEDEELAELLQDVLRSLGRHTDEERVRLKVAEEVTV
jgi:hypothetical protein